MAINAPACGRRQADATVHQAQARRRCRATAACCPASSSAAMPSPTGALTETATTHRGYRRLVHGVYADPGLAVRPSAPLPRRGAAAAARVRRSAGHSAAAWHGAPFAGASRPGHGRRSGGRVTWKGPSGVRVHRSQDRSADSSGRRRRARSRRALRTAWDVAAWSRWARPSPRSTRWCGRGPSHWASSPRWRCRDAGGGASRRSGERSRWSIRGRVAARVPGAGRARSLAGLTPRPAVRRLRRRRSGSVGSIWPFPRRGRRRVRGGLPLRGRPDRPGRRPLRPPPSGRLDGDPRQRRRPPRR